jgi:predicted SAM-dependent methyltransferase
MELLLGCGSNREKKLIVQGRSAWDGLVTLDIEECHRPDVVHDLNKPLPFADDSADEIHCYECLEHLGTQGDAAFFFAQFADFWRVLRPGGFFMGSVPSEKSPWAFGDPSHRRVIPMESLTFLSQPNYENVGKTPMTDFRRIWRADFDVIHLEKTEHINFFVLQAVKPSRVK